MFVWMCVVWFDWTCCVHSEKESEKHKFFCLLSLALLIGREDMIRPVRGGGEEPPPVNETVAYAMLAGQCIILVQVGYLLYVLCFCFQCNYAALFL